MKQFPPLGRNWTATLLCSVVACLGISQGPLQAITLKDRVGLVVHAFARTPQQQIQDLNHAKALGVGFIREDFHWQQIETALGSFDFSHYASFLQAMRAAKLKLLPIVGYGNPTLYPSFVASEYSPPLDVTAMNGYVQALVQETSDLAIGYEIWNEPNVLLRFYQGLGFWDAASHYFQLYKYLEQQIQLTRPDIPVVSGGLFAQNIGTYIGDWFVGIHGGFPYLEALVQENFDKPLPHLGWHPYSVPPKSYQSMTDIESFRKDLTSLQQYTNSIWLTEMGYHTAKFSPWPLVGVSPREQGVYLIRSIALSFAFGAETYVIYQLRDGGPYGKFWQEDAFGLISHDDQKKSSFAIVQQFMQKFGKASFVSSAIDRAGNIAEISFTDEMGQNLGLVRWRLSSKDKHEADFSILGGQAGFCLTDELGQKATEQALLVIASSCK